MCYVDFYMGPQGITITYFNTTKSIGVVNYTEYSGYIHILNMLVGMV